MARGPGKKMAPSIKDKMNDPSRPSWDEFMAKKRIRDNDTGVTEKQIEGFREELREQRERLLGERRGISDKGKKLDHSKRKASKKESGESDSDEYSDGGGPVQLSKFLQHSPQSKAGDTSQQDQKDNQ